MKSKSKRSAQADEIHEKQVLHETASIGLMNNIGIYTHYFYRGLLFLFFICCSILILNNSSMHTILNKSWSIGNFMLFFWLYIGMILSFSFLYKYNSKMNDECLVGLLFFLALFPRVFLALNFEWQPINDFFNYYFMGVSYLNGNYEGVAQTVYSYGISSFSGMAVLNGFLMRLFSITPLGNQIISSVLSSAITVPIFFLGKKYNRNVGLIAAIIFTIYPSNIIFSQVNTNQHGAILCALFSLNLLLSVLEEKGEFTRKDLIQIITAGLLMIFSYYFHPSWYTHLVAIAIFSVILLIEKWREANFRKKIAISIIVFAFSIGILNFTGMEIMSSKGLVPTGINQQPLWAKLYVGFNPETYGEYSHNDVVEINALPENEKVDFMLQGTLKRIKQVNILDFWKEKIKRMWSSPDTSFYWYQEGLNGALDQTIDDEIIYSLKKAKLSAATENINAFMWVDYVYIFIIYILAAVGIAPFGKDCRIRQMDLPMLALLGWISIHLLSEIQPRYRYFGMPIIMIFSAIGITKVFYLFKIRNKHLEGSK
ncbi:MAG: hypothetical protein AAGU12_03135 [Clostridiales bacterium]